VVELDAKRTARFSDRNREVETLMLNTQLIEVAERLAREVTDFRVVSLALQLGYDDNG
jgi:hypothetical protein